MKVGQQNERKFISVMICDIAGSYEFLYGQDPEDGKAVIDAAVQLMLDVVLEFNGHISQVQGDGLMALFGAPDAMEDHAQRVCESALEMVARFELRNRKLEWPFETQIFPKIGVSTGEAVVGQSVPVDQIKPDGVPEYIAVGAVSHLAGKLQKLAQPNDIVVSDTTAELIQSISILEPLTDVPVHERIPDHPNPYLLKSMSSSDGQWHAEGALSPFVGREEELYKLSEYARKAIGGAGSAVHVCGQAGIGKSRLVYEFVNNYLPRTMQHIHIRCESLQKNTPFAPLGTAVQQWFAKIGKTDQTPKSLLQAVATELEIDDSGLLEPLLPMVHTEYHHPRWDKLEPGIKRTKIVAALDCWITRLAAIQPLAMVVEDLHWADLATKEYVAQLANKCSDLPIVLIITCRDQDDLPVQPHQTELRLDTLDSADATEIARFHFSQGNPSTEWLSGILDRCGGIPLFIEELAKSEEAVEITSERDSLASVDVPDFLRVTIASRIDQLPAAPKQVLKIASVLGVSFPSGGLMHHYDGTHQQLDECLELLRQKGLLVKDDDSSEYRFKHALLQEVVYAGLVRSECRRVHQSVLDRLKEQLQSDSDQRIFQLLCYHARFAEQWDDLLHYSVAAGKDAMRCASYKEALHFYQQAIGALQGHPVEDNDMLASKCWLAISRASVPLGDIVGAFSALAQSKKAADKTNDLHLVCELDLYEVCLFTLSRDVPAAIECGDRAIVSAQLANSFRYQLGARIYHAQALFCAGEFRRVVESLQPLIEEDTFAQYGTIRMGNSAVVAVDAYGNLAMAYAQLGKFDRAITYGEKACEVAEADGGSFGIGLANFYLTYILVHQGQMKRSQRSLEKVRSLIESGGIIFLSPWLTGLLGFIHAKEGRLQEAQSLIDLSVNESRRMSLKMFEVYALVSQSMLCLDSGDLEKAEVVAREASALAKKGGFSSVEVWADRVRGRIAFADGDDEKGHQLLEIACQRAEKLGMNPDLAHCQLIRAEQFSKSGNSQQAESLAASALAKFEDMQMLRWIPEARKLT